MINQQMRFFGAHKNSRMKIDRRFDGVQTNGQKRGGNTQKRAKNVIWSVEELNQVGVLGAIRLLLTPEKIRL